MATVILTVANVDSPDARAVEETINSLAMLIQVLGGYDTGERPQVVAECWTCGNPWRFGIYNDPALSNKALADRHRAAGHDVRPVNEE